MRMPQQGQGNVQEDRWEQIQWAGAGEEVKIERKWKRKDNTLGLVGSTWDSLDILKVYVK